jgi:hypothetical protein
MYRNLPYWAGISVSIILLGCVLPTFIVTVIEERLARFDIADFFVLVLLNCLPITPITVIAGVTSARWSHQKKAISNILVTFVTSGLVFSVLWGIYFVHAQYSFELLRGQGNEFSDWVFFGLPAICLRLAVGGVFAGGLIGGIVTIMNRKGAIPVKPFIIGSVAMLLAVIIVSVALGGSTVVHDIDLWLTYGTSHVSP